MEEIILDEDFIVLAIPTDTVQVDITATVFHDGKLNTVSKTMGFQEVRDAFKEANEGYIPTDAVFTLTKMGEDKVEALVKKYMEKEEEE